MLICVFLVCNDLQNEVLYTAAVKKMKEGIKMIVGIVQIIVVVFITKWLLKRKTGEPFSRKTVTKFLLLGVCSTIVSLLINFGLERDTFFGMNPLLSGFLTAFITAALAEETAKYIAFRVALMKNKEVITWLDAIIAAVIVGGGFMILENFTKLISDGASIVGAILPMHLLFQAVMGYYYGKACVTKQFKYHVMSLVVPILLHTIFDMFLIGIMSILGNDRTVTQEKIETLPYGNYIMPLFICALIVTVIMLIFLIMAFKKINTWSKNGEKQERLSEEAEYN